MPDLSNMKITDVKVTKNAYDFEGNKGFNYKLVCKVSNYPLPIVIRVGKSDDNTRALLDLIAEEEK